MLSIPCVMEVNGAHLHVRMEGVLVEQNSASGIVRHMKMTRRILVLEVLNCFLQSNEVPFPRDMFFRWRLSCLVEVQGSSSEC